MSTTSFRTMRYCNIPLWSAALICLTGTACFHSLDPLKLKCNSKTSCPSPYSCTMDQGTYGHCVLGPVGLDGGNADKYVSPGLDGKAGLDGIGSDLIGSTDGAGGSPVDGSQGSGGAGGVGGPTDGSASGGAGGGGIVGGSGGVASPDAPSSTGGTTSVPDAPIALDGTDAPAGSANGTSCTADGQCANGHCIDGVCCATACIGCNACSNTLTGKDNGTCAPVLSGQSAHNACTDETATNQCGNDGTCDGKGTCRKVGTSHTCKAASCSSDGKTFTPTTTCDGNGACTTATAQDCGGFQCAVTGCLKNCTKDIDCGAGNYCDASVGKCAATKSNGAPATNGNECTSGVVADGVCCDKACTGCSACTSTLNGQGSTTTGQCLAVLANKAAPHSACTANPPCGLDGTCDGNGACHYPPAATSCGTPSCTGSTLTTSACDSTHACAPTTKACDNSLVCASASACKTGTCSADTDCISGDYCASGTCTAKKTGGTCTNASGNECSTGFCVDGYCCDGQCNGQCQSCKQTPGTCKAVTTPRTSCGGSGTCGTMKCNGTSPSCVYPGTEVSCPSTCSSDSTSVMSSTCNGSGACGTAQPSSCGSSAYCSGGQCTSKLSNGTGGCSSGVTCASGNCSTSLTGGTMCCAANWQNCSQGCYNLTSDPNHCGSCYACAPNQVCSASSCKCGQGSFYGCGNNDCTTWGFESNTVEGWENASGALTSLGPSTLHAHTGTHSLTFHVNSTGNGSNGSVEVPLCWQSSSSAYTPGTNVSGFSFYMMVVGNNFPSIGNYQAWIFDCSGNALAAASMSPWNEVNSWGSEGNSSTSSLANACYLQLNWGFGGAFQGDVYIDDVGFTSP